MMRLIEKHFTDRGNKTFEVLNLEKTEKIQHFHENFPII